MFTVRHSISYFTLITVLLFPLLGSTRGWPSTEGADVTQEEFDEVVRKIEAVKEAAQHQWVEIKTRNENSREYVFVKSTAKESEFGDVMRIYLRYDYAESAKVSANPLVQLLDVNCYEGLEAHLAVYSYDASGNMHLFSKSENPTWVNMLNLHSSVMQKICSGEYITDLVPEYNDVYLRAQKMQERRRRVNIPDRLYDIPHD